MFTFIKHQKRKFLFLTLSRVMVLVLSCSLVLAPSPGYAQSLPAGQTGVLNLPTPGAMVTLSPIFHPPIIKGMTIHPENPLLFDFIVHPGDDHLQDEQLKEESTKLIKYFMASLTVPEDQMWVNLSPYEKDRIVPERLGQTEMGRDLLAQDYLLKQLTASLMYPEDELGNDFWSRVHKEAREKYGTSEIPTNTFNKIWIIPAKASIYEHGTSVFVVDSHLKVMLEEDYLALEVNAGRDDHGVGAHNGAPIQTGIESEIIREILIPEIEKEVNEGKTFANLRQIYNSVILATWYKHNLKESLLGQVYVDQNKIQGIDTEDKQISAKIYNQYLEAFKVGVFNYIKEDYVAMDFQQKSTATPYAPAEGDQLSQQMIPRKYFSGGVAISSPILDVKEDPGIFLDEVRRVRVGLSPIGDVTIGTNSLEGGIGKVASSPVHHKFQKDKSGHQDRSIPSETIEKIEELLRLSRGESKKLTREVLSYFADSSKSVDGLNLKKYLEMQSNDGRIRSVLANDDRDYISIVGSSDVIVRFVIVNNQLHFMEVTPQNRGTIDNPEGQQLQKIADRVSDNIQRVISEQNITNHDLKQLFWSMDPKLIFTAEDGIARPLSRDEIFFVLRVVNDRLIGEGIMLNENVGYGTDLLRDFENMYTSDGFVNRVLLDERINEHAPFFSALDLEEDEFVIFLSRDAISAYETLVYSDRLTGRPQRSGLVYQPGLPATFAISHYRSSGNLEHVMEKTAEIFKETKIALGISSDVYSKQEDEAEFDEQLYDAFSRTFKEKLVDAIESDEIVKKEAEFVYQQIKGTGALEYRKVRVVDMQSTGRTVYYVKSVLEYFSEKEGIEFEHVDGFVGFGRGKGVGLPKISHKTPDERVQLIDVKWPFYMIEREYETGTVTFRIESSRYQILLQIYHSLRLYNLAVERHRRNQGKLYELKEGNFHPVKVRKLRKRRRLLALKRWEFLRSYRRKGYYRPGFFGNDRAKIYERLDEWFGPGNWEIRHLVDEKFITPGEALQLYEDAYFEHFINHPDQLEWLTSTAREVFDSARSNIHSGTNYDVQEMKGHHYQDIAIRNVLKRLGRKFEGDQYIQVRGPSSLGYHLSPGIVKFHRPEWILKPMQVGWRWWRPGTVEAFYQNSKVILVKEKAMGTMNPASSPVTKQPSQGSLGEIREVTVIPDEISIGTSSPVLEDEGMIRDEKEIEDLSRDIQFELNLRTVYGPLGLHNIAYYGNKEYDTGFAGRDNHVDFVRIGYLFFLDAKLYKKLSEKTQNKVKRNMILVNNLRKSNLGSPARMRGGMLKFYTASATLALMNSDLNNKKYIDAGAGDGILSLVAAKLGAKKVILIDNDPIGLAEARINLLLNGLEDPDDFITIKADLKDDGERIVDSIPNDGLGIVFGINIGGPWPDNYGDTTNVTGLRLIPMIEKRMNIKVSEVIIGGYSESYLWYRHRNAPSNPYSDFELLEEYGFKIQAAYSQVYESITHYAKRSDPAVIADVIGDVPMSMSHASASSPVEEDHDIGRTGLLWQDELAQFLRSYEGQALTIDELIDDLKTASKGSSVSFLDDLEISSQQDMIRLLLGHSGISKFMGRFTPNAIRLYARLVSQGIIVRQNLGRLQPPQIGDHYFENEFFEWQAENQPFQDEFLEWSVENRPSQNVLRFFHPDTDDIYEVYYSLPDQETGYVMFYVFNYFATGRILMGMANGILGSADLDFTGDIPGELKKFLLFFLENVPMHDSNKIGWSKIEHGQKYTIYFDLERYEVFKAPGLTTIHDEKDKERIQVSFDSKAENSVSKSLSLNLKPFTESHRDEHFARLESVPFTPAERSLFWRNLGSTQKNQGRFKEVLEMADHQGLIKGPILELGGGDDPLSAKLFQNRKVVVLDSHLGFIEEEPKNVLFVNADAEALDSLSGGQIQSMTTFLEQSELSVSTWLEGFNTIIISHLLNYVDVERLAENLASMVPVGTTIIIHNDIHFAEPRARHAKGAKSNREILEAFGSGEFKTKRILGHERHYVDYSASQEEELNVLTYGQALDYEYTLFLILERSELPAAVVENVVSSPDIKQPGKGLLDEIREVTVIPDEISRGTSSPVREGDGLKELIINEGNLANAQEEIDRIGQKLQPGQDLLVHVSNSAYITVRNVNGAVMPTGYSVNLNTFDPQSLASRVYPQYSSFFDGIEEIILQAYTEAGPEADSSFDEKISQRIKERLQEAGYHVLLNRDNELDFDMVGSVGALNDLFVFSSDQKLKTNLNLLIDEIRTPGGNIILQKDLDTQVKYVRIDKDVLHRILLDLLVNAKQAMPNGGTVTITTELDEGAKEAVIKISDTGEGVPTDVLPKIFDLRFTTKKRGSGTGLHQVRERLASAGGTIEPASVVGEGTTFTIRLPIFDQVIRRGESLESDSASSPVKEKEKELTWAENVADGYSLENFPQDHPDYLPSTAPESIYVRVLKNGIPHPKGRLGIKIDIYPEQQVIHIRDFFPKFPSKFDDDFDPAQNKKGRGRALLRHLINTQKFEGYHLVANASPSLTAALESVFGAEQYKRYQLIEQSQYATELKRILRNLPKSNLSSEQQIELEKVLEQATVHVKLPSFKMATLPGGDQTSADDASSPVAVINAKQNPGGIDLNPQAIEMDKRGEVTNFQLPAFNPAQFQNSHIEGFLPIIINISPISNIPLLLGLTETEAEPTDLGFEVLDPLEKKDRFKMDQPQQVSLLN